MRSSLHQEIAIDARAHVSGLGVYTRNLVRELHDSFAWSIHALSHRDRISSVAPYCTRISVVDAPLYSLQEQLQVLRSTRQDKVLHVPHYNLPLLYCGCLLLTIHDLTHLLYPGYAKSWKSRLYAEPMLLAGVRRARHVFTVSEYSKAQIVEHLGADPAHVSVVYNGVGAEFYPGDRSLARTAVAERFGIETPFILYVGNLKAHKNVEALLQAFAELTPKLKAGCALVLVGSDQSGIKAISALSVTLRTPVHFINTASTAEVADIYRAAEALVMPSFEEGFGLPVIEAMACGTPTICSNRASLPEIAGNATLYFDPSDFHQLAELLWMLLQSPSLRDSLSARGLTQAGRFTWKDTAERHVDIYRQVCA